jgi:hypothetical protein
MGACAHPAQKGAEKPENPGFSFLTARFTDRKIYPRSLLKSRSTSGFFKRVL